jgi:GT2 family glycosyltransferase
VSERLLVIVLNWNRYADTLRCLASLADTSISLTDILVVDNASTDGSVEAIRSSFPTVQIVRNTENLGYAAGNNVGLHHAIEARYEYALLLNNDTVVATDAIDALVEPLRAHPRIAVCGAAIAYLSEPTRVWSAGGVIQRRDGSVTTDWLDRHMADLPSATYAVDHVSGCCLLVRVSAIQQVGFLDPRFFMYFEETEWCARFTRANWEIVVNPAARIWHAIDPVAQSGSPAIAYYMTRNHLLFLRASRAPLSAWAITVFRQFRTVVSLFIRPHTANRTRGRMPMLRAMRDFTLGRFGPLNAAR